MLVIVKSQCVFDMSFGRSIDIDDAMAVPGVVTFVSAKDIPGSNKTGPAVYDETVFADDKVTYIIYNVNLMLLINNTG